MFTQKGFEKSLATGPEEEIVQQLQLLRSKNLFFALIALCIGLLAPFGQIQTVAAAASITITPQSIAVGNPVGYGVQIDGSGFQGGTTSTATVQLKFGSTVLSTKTCNVGFGSILNSTTDHCDYSSSEIAALTQGTYTITVSSNNTTNTATANLYITGFRTSLNLSTSASVVPESSPITLTATLKNVSTDVGISGKLINFSLFKDSTNQEVNIVTATTNASGVATVTISAISSVLTGGSTVTALVKFLGDSTTAFTTGVAPFSIARRATTTAVSCTPATITIGGSATTCTATVTDVDSGTKIRPDGTVTFSANPANLGSFNSSATCALSTSGTNAKSCSRTFSGTAAGTAQISASYTSTGSDSHANSASTTTANVTISSGVATLSVSNTTQTYNGSPRPVTVTTTPSGLSGVTVTYNGSTTAPTNAGTYAVNVSLTNPNYTATPVNTTLTITKATATLALSNTSQTYDGTPKSVTVTTTPSGLSGVSVTYDGSTTAPTNVGTYTVVATLTNSNYTATPANGTLTITKATPVINWSNPADITYGTALDATQLNATVSPNIPGTFTYTPAAGAVLSAGLAQILSLAFTPTDTANYNNAAPKTVTINVGKANQTIAFGTLADKTYLESDFNLTATASSGLTVSFVASGKCTVTGSTVHLTGAGSCTITASQAGDSNYNAAPTVDQTFNIGKAPATIALNNLSQTYTGSALAPTAVTTPLNLTVSFSYTPGPQAINAGSYSVTATIVDNDYQGSTPDIFVITKANQTITFSPIADVMYGLPAFPIVATSTSSLAVTFSTNSNCSEAGSNISILGAGPCTVTASQAGNGNYNPAADVVQTFTIAKAPLVVHTDDKTRPYGQPNPAFSGVITGFVYSEPSSVLGGVISWTTNPLADETSPVETYAIIPSGLTSNNYEISFLNGTLTIVQTAPVITWANPADIVYGTTLSATQLNAIASVPGTFAYTPADGTVLNAGNAQTLSVLFTPTDSANYTTATKSVLINVLKADQTISFSLPGGKTYGDMPFTVSATASSNLPVTFSGAGSCTVSGNTVTIISAGICTVTASQAGDSNYNPASNPQTTTIAKAPLSVKANDASRIYSAPDPAFSVSYSGFVNNENETTPGAIGGSLSFTTSATVASPVGNTYTITPSGLTAPNYLISFADGILTINKADTTTVGANATSIYSPTSSSVTLNATVTSNSPSTATVSEGTVEFTVKQGTTVIGSTTSGNVSGGSASVSYTIPGGTIVGSYSIEAVYIPATVAANFNGSSDTTKTLAIGKANQTITFAPLADKSYLDAPFTVSATASSGLAVTFAASGNCTVAIDIVTITGVSSCTITASQAGDGNYNPAPDVSQSFNIGKATPVITWANPADIVYGTALSATQLNATASTAGTFAYTPDTGQVLNAGLAQTLSVTFTPTNTANFTSASKSVLINVAKANQTITFGSLGTKTYGDLPFPVSGTASSNLALVFTSLGNCSVSGNTVTIMGAGGCTITASQPGDSNYNAATPVDHTFIINEATLTVTADNKSKVFGELNPTFTVSYSSFVYSETPSVLTGAPIFSANPVATTSSPVGSYTITPSGLFSSNYLITFAAGTLTINKADTTTVAADALNPYNPANSSVTLNATVTSNAPSSAVVNEGTVEFTVKQGTTVIGTTTSGNVTAGAASVSYTIPGGTIVGSYSIEAVYIPATVAPNFNGSSDLSKLLGIGKTTQTITFGTLANKTYLDPAFTVSAMASSGLAVSFAPSGNCTIAVDLVTITGAGSCTITASQAGDSNYNPATDVSQSFNIGKATPVITWANPADIVYGTALSATQLNATASTAGTFAYTPDTSTVLPGGSNQTLSVLFTPTDSANYTTATKSVLINVGKSNQTITFAPLADKTYGNAAFTVSATASSGLNVSFAATVGNCTVLGNLVAISGAGSCTITASQAGDGNYSPAADVPRTFTIAKTLLLIQANNASRVYGAPNPTFTVNYTGFVYADNAGALGGSLGFTTAPEVTAASPVGSYILLGYGLSSSNYNIFYGLGTLTINKADTTTVATNASAAFTATSVTLNATVTANSPSTAIVNEGTVEFTVKQGSTIIGSATSGNVTAGAASVSYTLPDSTIVGSYTIEAIYVPASVAPNFNGSSDATHTLGVGKANQTINFAALANKVYGEADFNLTATATSGLTVSYIATGNCTVTGSTVHITGAGSCSITASQAGDTSYFAATDVVQGFNITKATALITLGGLSQTYDGTAKSVTATTTPTGLTVTFTYDGSATAPTNAGSYAVVGTIVDTNYVGSANGTLVIGKASQTITFGPLANKTFGNPDFTVSATASSGLSVSFAATGSCTVIAGNTVHLTGAGSCTITASQAGNSNYSAATDVPQSFTITQGTATVTLGNLSQVYNGTPRSATATTVPTGLTVNITYNGSTTAPTNAGSYAVIATIMDTTYSGSATGTLVIAKATPVITWNNPADISYGTALSGTQLNATASVAGTFVYSPAAGTVLSAGNAQTLSVTFTPTSSANYTTAIKSVTINVLKAALTITANNKSRNYLVANPTFDATYSGFVNGDTAASLTGTLSCTTTATQTSTPGTYPITCSGQSSSNYNITYVPGTLTILSGPDNIAPTTVATRNPLPNAAGWNNTNVTITLNATDNVGGSGVKQIVYSATGAQTIASTTVSGSTVTFTITAEGTTTISFFARDNANNTETTKTLTIKLDKTPPTFNANVDCSTPDGNWHATDETVWCSINSPDLVGPSDFTLVTNVPAGTETNNAYTNSKQVCDVAGNCITVGPIGPHKIDKKRPTVTITAPTAANYKLGQVVKANFACADGGSGVGSCSGTVANNTNIDTSSVGTKTFSVTAQDNMGNQTTKTVTYTVSYNVSFVTASPVPAGTPVRMQLLNANNVNVSAGNIAVTALTRDGVAISGNTAFTFGQSRYSYTVNTTGLSRGVHTLTFKAGNDPTIYTIQFIV